MSNLPIIQQKSTPVNVQRKLPQYSSNYSRQIKYESNIFYKIVTFAFIIAIFVLIFFLISLITPFVLSIYNSVFYKGFDFFMNLLDVISMIIFGIGFIKLIAILIEN